MIWGHPTPLHCLKADGTLEGQSLSDLGCLTLIFGFHGEYPVLMVSCANNFWLTMCYSTKSCRWASSACHLQMTGTNWKWCSSALWFCFASVPVGFFPRCKQEKPEGFVAAAPGFQVACTQAHTHMNIENVKANPNLIVSLLAGNSLLFLSEKFIGSLYGKTDV